jgi:cytochrome c oxidase cbb3-type subunit III
MRSRTGVFLSASCAALAAVALIAAPGAPPGGAQAPAGGRQGGNPQATFPAQQRPPGDPALVARGNGLYGVHCRACHGVDLRGGDIGGPNLLRSPLALNDQEGELLGPLILEGRQSPGMPPMPPITLPPEDIRAIAAYIHSVQATMRGQGSPPAGAPVVLDILVGNAAAGEAYFRAQCSGCHSPSGDLQGLARRFPDPVQLQNLWVSGGRVRGRAGGAASARSQTMVMVTLPDGQRVEGHLDRIDDFIVVLTTAEGVQRSFGRRGGVPAVEVRDPLDAHRRLLAAYADSDIHDVTAYLVTLQ